MNCPPGAWPAGRRQSGEKGGVMWRKTGPRAQLNAIRVALVPSTRQDRKEEQVRRKVTLRCLGT